MLSTWLPTVINVGSQPASNWNDDFALVFRAPGDVAYQQDSGLDTINRSYIQTP